MTPDAGTDTGTPEAYVAFHPVTVDAEQFAVERGRVRRIVDTPAVTRVPRSPPDVRGMTSVDGEVVVVADGRALLGLDPFDDPGDASLVVLESEPLVGVLVDAVSDAERHHVDHVLPETDDKRPIKATFADSERGGETVSVFDVDALVHAVGER